MQWMSAGAEAWSKGLESWSQMLGQATKAGEARDRRFGSPEWSENPLFDTMRQSYLAISDKLLGTVEEIEGIDEAARSRLRFATKGFVDAMSPANYLALNPQVMKRTIDTKGENLIAGLKNMLGDIQRGQVSQSPEGAFELGRNLAVTPGKVIHETRLYQLIQYAPATETVLETPLVIFPPWINRFYILDLTPEKSFVKWTVDQGVTLFMVSWKSADASIADITQDDYIAAQIEAVELIRDLLGVKAVHTIGYCVAGTTLAASLAYLEAKKEAKQVASATFFTAQVDFAEAGDLTLFLGDDTMKTLETLTAETGVLDGRVMAATFNLLRGRDLIWNYVVNNYLHGQRPAAVRPAPLERRRDQPARRLAPRLSPGAVPREQARRAGRGQRDGGADRPHHDHHAGLYPGRARGPYRAERQRVEADAHPERAQALRAGRVGAYRRRGQPARRGQISILDQRERPRAGDPRRLRRGGDRA